ncbi:MAG: carbamoyltransferase, partial [Candidatus Zixiibacteriota bacterium]
QGFDSAAALITPRGIRAAAAEERFSGNKGTNAFPANAIRYCLQAGNLTPSDIDHVAHGFSYEPLKDVFDGNPFSQQQFCEIYARENQANYLEEFFPDTGLADKLVEVPHHLAHAASAYYLSGFKESLIMVVDGMGEVHSTTVAVGRGRNIDLIQSITAPHSLGILYGVVTLYLGFWMSFDEHKVMGLAPYGNPRRYFNQMMEFVRLLPDGMYTVPILFRNTTPEEKETYRGTLRVLEETFGPPRQPGSDITQHHKDIAAALQAVLQAGLLHVLRHFKKATGQQNLCMAGGVALNCSANGVIKRSRMFKDMFIQPAATDDGTAVGAALYVQNQVEGKPAFGKMLMPLWGPEFSGAEIERVLIKRRDVNFTPFASFDALIDDTARRLAKGEVIAWFQGRMEYGPRALGNRSILADPRNPYMRTHINRLVKKREGFRPFAPAVTVESAPEYFEIDPGDESLYAYMLCVTQVKQTYRDKLPAITHVDGSARVQTVSREGNPRLWQLLGKFGELTGIPILLNTSFNLRGQPIICAPSIAVETFAESEINMLVLEDFIVTRCRENSLDDLEAE